MKTTYGWEYNLIEDGWTRMGSEFKTLREARKFIKDDYSRAQPYSLDKKDYRLVKITERIVK